MLVSKHAAVGAVLPPTDLTLDQWCDHTDNCGLQSAANKLNIRGRR